MIAVDETCSCLLTPPGAGAIGVIRVAGADAETIVSGIFQPAGLSRRNHADGSWFEEGRLRYGRLVIDDEVVDDVIVSRAASDPIPAFDISAHGGVRVIERILEALEQRGAPFRPAAELPIPTWPADHQIDREAIEAIPRVKTTRAVRFLAWQRQHLAPRLDEVARQWNRNVDEAKESLRAMLARFQTARTLIDGATVVLVGPPNSGKSTLFNRLAGRPAAMVSTEAGTTRDWVTTDLEIDGVPVALVDTAGQRKTSESVECQAMHAGWDVARRAELVLFMLDGSEPLLPSVGRLLEAARLFRNCLLLINKADLPRAWKLPAPSLDDVTEGRDLLDISAQHGTGLEALVQRLLSSLGFRQWIDGSPAFFTQRQAELAARMLIDPDLTPDAASALIHGALLGRTRTNAP